MATGNFTLKQVNQAIAQGAWTGYIAPKWVEYLVVAGGGAGGGATSGTSGMGGGGAGGLLTGIVTVATGTSYTVTVGAGGTGGTSTGASGSNSVFGSIVSSGGGGGGPFSGNGVSGGSGGGGSGDGIRIPGQGTGGQGNTGGSSTNNAAGGGGGAGTIGLNSFGTSGPAGNGGAGIASAISGSVVTYAGGGGGAYYSGSSTTTGQGGVGGGGTAGYVGSTNGTSGGGNTGGGGGGGCGNAATGTGGSGGSGIVIVRYPGTVQFFTGGTLSYANGYMIHTFYASGTLAPTTPAAYIDSAYQISRSLRFNSADSAYLNRTPAGAGNRQTWTWSAWVKRGTIGTTQILFVGGQDSSNYTNIYFSGSVTDNLELYTYTGAATAGYYYTSSVFRDPSAWYHIVCSVDTTAATAADRVKLYVNGVLQTTTVSSAFTQNANTWVNSANPHYLGRNQPSSQYFDGYLTEVNFIDGQALTPLAFGYTNPETGVWSPVRFVGTYGTNGFYLKFSDNSNTTAATLGKDSSGNGNNFTPNNFSVTAGIGNDSFVDSPTLYGTDTGVGDEVRGNYATLNAIFTPTTSAVTNPTLTNGNLSFVGNATTDTSGRSTIGVTSGKWYCEVKVSYVSALQDGLGIAYTQSDSSRVFGVLYRASGDKCVNNTVTSYGTNYAAGSLIGIALDADNNTVTFYNSNNSQGSISFTPSTAIYFSTYGTNASPAFAGDINFGQRPFVYTAPSGYKALCTQNLPTPAVGATSTTTTDKYFGVSLYTGNGSSQSITNSGLMQPDWVWVKCRNAGLSNSLYDSVRGVRNTLATNSTAAQTSESAGYSLTSFNSNGFSVGLDNVGIGSVNGTSNTYIAWQWKAGGTGVTNTAGTITSTVSASPTSGFSVVTYTGNGTTGATVGHGLGTTPSMIIVKAKTVPSGTNNWGVWNKNLSSGQVLFLNLTNAATTSTGYFTTTSPTSSVFSVGNDADTNYSASYTYVAYCFAEVDGFSKFSTYIGNGSSSGPFVYTGFKPKLVIIKQSSANTTAWRMVTINTSYLSANESSAEYDSPPGPIAGYSNGFRVVGTGGDINQSGSTFIYAAFAETPFKYSLAR